MKRWITIITTTMITLGVLGVAPGVGAQQEDGTAGEMERLYQGWYARYLQERQAGRVTQAEEAYRNYRRAFEAYLAGDVQDSGDVVGDTDYGGVGNNPGDIFGNTKNEDSQDGQDSSTTSSLERLTPLRESVTEAGDGPGPSGTSEEGQDTEAQGGALTGAGHERGPLAGGGRGGIVRFAVHEGIRLEGGRHETGTTADSPSSEGVGAGTTETTDGGSPSLGGVSSLAGGGTPGGAPPVFTGGASLSGSGLTESGGGMDTSTEPIVVGGVQ